jgi:acyl dehydratase
MIRPSLRATAVRAGERLPALERTFSLVDLVAYGAATWDWNRMHYDVEHARSMKLPNPVIDGQAFGALLARAALDWAGPRAFIKRLSFKMKSMAFAGDTLRAEGEVTAVRDGVAVLAQRLTSAGRLVAEATTEIQLAA